MISPFVRLEPNNKVINLALRKPAKQSSNFNSAAVAKKAVDGNNDGRWRSGSVTHTKRDYQAFWEVDLIFESEISSIIIFNRIDCCRDRLTHFYIKFYDYTHSLVKTLFHGSTAQNVYKFGLVPSIVARYVRVQIKSRNYLSLAEVQVYGKAVKRKKVLWLPMLLFN